MVWYGAWLQAINASDFALILLPNFTHGRAGDVAATSSSVRGASAGLRSRTLRLLQGAVLGVNCTSANATVDIPTPNLAVHLDAGAPLVFTTDLDAATKPDDVIAKTAQCVHCCCAMRML